MLGQGLAPALVLPAVLLCGLLLGALNGSLSALLHLPSFIVTVATMGIFRGLAYIVSGGMPAPVDNEAFLWIGNGEWLGMPVPIWILAALLAANHFVLARTVFGRKIYLAGGNAEAATYAGIRVGRLKIAIFMLSGLMAAVGGLLLTSRLYSAQDRKSTRLNSSHLVISYAVFCLKKKKTQLRLSLPTSYELTDGVYDALPTVYRRHDSRPHSVLHRPTATPLLDDLASILHLTLPQ